MNKSEKTPQLAWGGFVWLAAGMDYNLPIILSDGAYFLMFYLLQGATLGLAATATPGPFLAFLL